MMLITNGGSAAQKLSEVFPDTVVLPWDDVLHEGPVTETDLAALRPIRSRYLAASGWADSVDTVDTHFMERDQQLDRFQDAEVALVYEHDLYDQLQLCQLLHYFSGGNNSKVTIAQADTYLGEMSSDDLQSVLDDRLPVSDDQYDLSRRVWEIFVSTSHRSLVDMDYSSLRHLGPAILRLLAEYPDEGTGLAQSRRMVLEILAGGSLDPVSLFREHMVREEAKYLGDSVFWSYVEELTSRDVPLVNCGKGVFRRPEAGSDFNDQELSITDAGVSVLDGREDDVLLNGIDRWIGGVHLSSDDCPRWSVMSRSFA